MITNQKKTAFGAAFGGCLLLLLGALHYGGYLRKGVASGKPYVLDTVNNMIEGEKSTASETAKESREIIVEPIATGLVVPWSLAFTSSERMLVTVRPGNVYQIERGKLDIEPIATFPEVASGGEEGLMGLAIDPDYNENKYVYVSLAYPKNGAIVLKVMRFRDDGTRWTEPLTLIDDIPAAQYHAGSRIQFGPDKKLYVTTGDATDKNLAQNMDSFAGKILRMNTDGSTPEDNPIRKSLIYSLGHRNPQGIAWHPVTDELYSTEHGPSLFDGPGGGDEVNRIIGGGNYGWPIVSHEKKSAGTVAPLLLFTPAVAPASAAFYGSDKIPQFQNQLFFGGLKGEGLFRVKLDDDDPDKILEYEKLKEVNVGRIREVITGPDNALYFTTSNRDGRGKSTPGDDKIYRLRAK